MYGLELLIQVQNLVKADHTSTHFRDIYHYITSGRLHPVLKHKTDICAEALNYVVVDIFYLE